MSHRSFTVLALLTFALLIPLTHNQKVLADPSDSQSGKVSTTIYVSPSGSDTLSGTTLEINAAKNTGPIATFQRAKQLVAQQKKSNAASGKTGPIKVLFRGGTYQVDRPIVLTPDDSGTKETPITYAAYPDEKPVFCGAMEVTGFNSWKKEPTGSLWQIKLDEVAAAAIVEYRSLFLDGKRATVARTPNAPATTGRGSFDKETLDKDALDKEPPAVPAGSGWFMPTGPEKPLDRGKARKDVSTKKSFRYAGDNIKPSELAGELGKDAIICYYHAWTASLHRIESIDEDEKLVRLKHHSCWPIGWWGDKERFYIENYSAALDAPGEWYFDPTTRLLRYYPLPGQDMTRVKTTIPCVRELLVLQGDLNQKRYLEHLTFDGLAFEQTGWTVPESGLVDGQAAAFLQKATVRAIGARNCRFNNCRIAHTGGYALWLRHGCKDNTIEHCEMTDLGAGGVRLGECGLPKEPEKQAERNEVLHCRIHDGGHIYKAGIGVWIGRSSHNRLAHCDIHDFFYSGVSIGWSWGYAPSTAHHNLIEFNHIHHLGKRQLADMGGVYHLGQAPGTVIRNNLIHDIYSHSYGGWALYTDEGSTGVLMENNIGYNVTDGAFHQHYGKENILRNNILAFSDMKSQVRWTRAEEHLSFTLERNIIYGEKTPPLSGNNKVKCQLDRNLYWNRLPDTLKFPGGVDFATWQKNSGQDQNSKVADPKFKDPAGGDFSLPTDSPAWEIGFKPIDLSRVGPQE